MSVLGRPAYTLGTTPDLTGLDCFIAVTQLASGHGIEPERDPSSL
jgi:hypothetical protein